MLGERLQKTDTNDSLCYLQTESTLYQLKVHTSSSYSLGYMSEHDKWHRR